MLEYIKPFNFILACDGYKIGHWEELPKDVLYDYSVIVPRLPSNYSNDIVAMGQTLLANILANVRITYDMIDEAEQEVTEQGYSFNRSGWQKICHAFEGRLPLSVYGVEEGRVVSPQTPIIGIINTDPEFAWLVSYIETFAQQIIWKMSTVASICRTIRVGLEDFCVLTGTNTKAVDFMLHNFGDRGADSPDEAPIMAGIAHAALFDGSDCIRANGYIKRLYHTNIPSTTSIEATEHSVMCKHSNAETRDDLGAAIMAVDRLYAAVDRYKNHGIGLPYLSVVIDTYDSRRFVREYLGNILKDKIIESTGKIIARPDSGDPTIEPGLVGQDLADTFGYSINPQGYKVLPNCVGVIQGDGIKITTWKGVVEGWIKAGFSLDCFALGMGSGITHDGARDDFSFSCKSIASFRSNKGWQYELKDPNTDSQKKSLSGLIRCCETSDGKLEVVDYINNPSMFLLETSGWKLWFNNGVQKYQPTWDSVKQLARGSKND